MHAEFLQGLTQFPLIPLLRDEDPELCHRKAQKILRQDFPLLELTFSTREVSAVVKKLKEEFPQANIGLGTIRHQEEMKEALDSPADFFVSPHFSKDLFQMSSGRLYIPGVLTPSEIFEALSAGAFLLKLFPANFWGVSGLRSLRQIAADVPLLVSGGIELDNAKAYLEGGATALAIGSKLVSKEAWDDDELFVHQLNLWRHLVAAN